MTADLDGGTLQTDDADTHRRRRIIPAVVALVLLLAGSTSAQRDEPDFTGPVVRPQGLAKEAMIYRFRLTRDPGLLAEQVYAVEQYRNGVDPQQIVADGLAKRLEWARLRQAGVAGEWGANGYAATVARLLGRAASQRIPGGGSAGVEVANLGIRAYEDLVRGRRVSRAAQRQAEEFTRWQEATANPTTPEGQVFDLSRRTCEESPDFCRDVWEPLFLSSYGFRPDSSNQAVRENYPEFANHEAIAAVVELQRHQGSGQVQTRQLLETVLEIQAKNVDVLRETRADLATSSDQVTTFFVEYRERWALEERVAAQRRKDKINAIEVAAYRSAVNMAATIIGFSDPSLGRQIKVTSDAVFRAREALDAYRSAIELGASDRVAGLVLAGDYLSLGLMVVGAFVDTGPTGDDIILREVNRLREEVQELRREMHERFDQVYTAVINGFEAVLGNQQLVIERLDTIASAMISVRSKLSEVGRMQLDTQRLLVQQVELVADLTIRETLGNCGWDVGGGWDRRRSGLARGEFEGCLGRMEAQLAALLLDEHQLPAPQSMSTAEAWLTGRPDRTISWSLREFRRLLRETGEESARRAGGLPASVVGPEAWFYVADLYDGFLAAYPEHVAELTGDSDDGADSDFIRFMRTRRLDLVNYAAAIRDELAAFQAGSRATVFSRLLAEAWDGSVQANVEEWSRRTRGDYDDEFIRALQRDMAIRNAHLRSWIALAFYDSLGPSESLREIMEGAVRLPDRAEDWNRVGSPTTPPPPLHGAAEVGIVVRDKIREMEEFLGSAAMRNVVAYGYGHSLLMGTVFDSLGDSN